MEVLRLAPIVPQRPVSRKPGNVLDNPFSNAAAKVRRAATHIDSAFEALQQYLQTSHWQIDVSSDPASSEIVFLITMKDPLPSELEAIISDALSNMRSALNLLVSDLVRANGKQVSRQNAFPSAENQSKYAREVEKRLEGISPRARRFIDRLRPHGNGQSLFWRLAEVRNTDEHHYIHPVVLGRLSMAMQVGMPGVYTSPDGGLYLGGGPPGSFPSGYEQGAMSPIDAPEIALEPKVATEIYRGKRGLEHLQFEMSVNATFLIGPEVGPIDLLLEMYDLVSRTVAVAQRRLA